MCAIDQVSSHPFRADRFIGDFPGLPPELTPGVPYPLRRSAEMTFGNEFPGRLEPGEVLPFRGMPPADRE